MSLSSTLLSGGGLGPLVGHLATPFTSILSDWSASILGSTAHGFLLKNEVFTAGVSLMLLTGVFYVLKQYAIRLYVIAQSWIYCSLTINSGDELFDWLIEWFEQQGYMERSSDLVLESILEGSSQQQQQQHRHRSRHGKDDPRKPTMRLSPVVNRTYRIRFRHRTISMIREQNQDTLASLLSSRGFGGRLKERLVLRVAFASKKLLLDLVDAAVQFHFAEIENKTMIYYPTEHNPDMWLGSFGRDKRQFSSVVLDEEMKDEVVRDIDRFLASRQWYENRGIPYRRGYLLHGPPGTGKTSFILSIAGKFNLNLCLLSFGVGTKLTDRGLLQLLQTVRSNSIIVLEDVDAAFVAPCTSDGVDPRVTVPASGITFSGFLNALDGLASADGNIMFLTTNHIDRLSPALIRPGRVDRRFLFDLATTQQIRGMYSRFFESSDFVPPSDPKEDEDSRSPDDDHRIVEAFVEKIGNKRVSPAQLQNLFIRCMFSSPKELLSSLPGFLEECRLEHHAPPRG